MQILIHKNSKGENDKMEMFQVMESKGCGFGRAYIYFDDPKHILLDSMSVNEDSRNLGIGLKLQEVREQIGREHGCKYSVLSVDKGTWLINWYKRRGYKWYGRYEPDENFESIRMWMKKKL